MMMSSRNSNNTLHRQLLKAAFSLEKYLVATMSAPGVFSMLHICFIYFRWIDFNSLIHLLNTTISYFSFVGTKYSKKGNLVRLPVQGSGPHGSSSWGQPVIQDAERNGCWCSTRFLLLIHPQTPAHKLVQTTVRVGLLSSANLILKLPHKHAMVCCHGDSRYSQVDSHH